MHTGRGGILQVIESPIRRSKLDCAELPGDNRQMWEMVRRQEC